MMMIIKWWQSEHSPHRCLSPHQQWWQKQQEKLCWKYIIINNFVIRITFPCLLISKKRDADNNFVIWVTFPYLMQWWGQDRLVHLKLMLLAQSMKGLPNHPSSQVLSNIFFWAICVKPLWDELPRHLMKASGRAMQRSGMTNTNTNTNTNTKKYKYKDNELRGHLMKASGRAMQRPGMTTRLTGSLRFSTSFEGGSFSKPGRHLASRPIELNKIKLNLI